MPCTFPGSPTRAWVYGSGQHDLEWTSHATVYAYFVVPHTTRRACPVSAPDRRARGGSQSYGQAEGAKGQVAKI
jgi:hypothetical protein